MNCIKEKELLSLIIKYHFIMSTYSGGRERKPVAFAPALEGFV